MEPIAADAIAVTGVGCISGLGVGVAAFEDGLFAARSALAPITDFDTSESRSHLAGRIEGFDPAAFIDRTKLRRIDSVGRLALASCHLALGEARLDAAADPGSRHEIGVAVGTATAGLHTLVGYLDRLTTEGPSGASALDFSNTVGNAAASLCGLTYGLGGPNITLASKEASGLTAVASAADLVRSGQARVMIAGGVDDFDPTFFAVFDRFKVLATDKGDGEASRPFDRRRNGFVLGNGAAMVVLERVDAAADRRIERLGVIAGIGATASPAGLNRWPSDAAQLVRCMRQALADAHVAPSDVSLVFASANSTPALDRIEAQAITEVFGPFGVPVVALKGALGECGASTSAAIVAALLSLQRRQIPPTAGFAEPDPSCPVDVSAQPRSMDAGVEPAALVNAFASGGTNCSLVIRA